MSAEPKSVTYLHLLQLGAPWTVKALQENMWPIDYARPGGAHSSLHFFRSFLLVSHPPSLKPPTPNGPVGRREMPC